jgi:hypothetical protein
MEQNQHIDFTFLVQNTSAEREREQNSEFHFRFTFKGQTLEANRNVLVHH